MSLQSLLNQLGCTTFATWLFEIRVGAASPHFSRSKQSAKVGHAAQGEREVRHQTDLEAGAKDLLNDEASTDLEIQILTVLYFNLCSTAFATETLFGSPYRSLLVVPHILLYATQCQVAVAGVDADNFHSRGCCLWKGHSYIEQ